MIFTMIGRANKHHGELAYIRKRTWWSNNVMKSTELSSIIYQDHQQVAKQWIHWFPGIYSHLDGTRPFPYTLKRSVYWSPCSLNYCLVHSGEFHPNNLQYNSDHHFGHLSLRLETMHYKTHSSDLLWDPLNRRRPKMHEPLSSSTH